MAYVCNRGKSKDPTWYIRYKDPAAGKWRQRPAAEVNGRKATRAEAEIEAKRLDLDIIDGKPPPPRQKAAPPKRLTVKELVERFLDPKDGYNRPRIKDIAAYRRHTRAILNAQLFISPLAGKVAEEVKRLDVARWRDEMRGRKYSPSATNRAISALSAVFSWAEREEVLTGRNPCHGVERMPEQPAEAYYTVENIHAILNLPDLPVMLAVALYEGLRKGELLGLTWGCVRLDGDLPRIEVRKSYSGPPKSGKPRTLPIHPELLPVLRAWKERCPATEAGLVFPVEVRGKLRMGKPNDMCGIKEILTAAGVQSIPADPWHAARHSFATSFLEASGNGHALSLLLGHAMGGGAAPVTAGYVHTSLAYLHRELVKMTLWPPAPAGVTRLHSAQR